MSRSESCRSRQIPFRSVLFLDPEPVNVFWFSLNGSHTTVSLNLHSCTLLDVSNGYQTLTLFSFLFNFFQNDRIKCNLLYSCKVSQVKYLYQSDQRGCRDVPLLPLVIPRWESSFRVGSEGEHRHSPTLCKFVPLFNGRRNENWEIVRPLVQTEKGRTPVC